MTPASKTHLFISRWWWYSDYFSIAIFQIPAVILLFPITISLIEQPQDNNWDNLYSYRHLLFQQSYLRILACTASILSPSWVSRLVRLLPMKPDPFHLLWKFVTSDGILSSSFCILQNVIFLRSFISHHEILFPASWNEPLYERDFNSSAWLLFLYSCFF